MRIVLIDDDPTVRSMLAEALENMGHDVCTARDGGEGLLNAALHTPDVVLTDIRMPGISGLQVLELLTQADNPPRVVLLTAYAELDSAIQAVQNGACDYVCKPFDIADLQQRLARIQRDLDREREAEEREARSAHQARLASVERLAAGVCHEINNPACIIHGNAQLLEQLLRDVRGAGSARADRSHDSVGEADREMPELLQRIQRNILRIRDITHGLLCFADAQPPHPMEDGWLNSCLQDALLLMPPSDTPKPRFVMDLDADLPLVPMCRRDVTQALFCILTNAAQAVADGSEPTVRVRTRCLADGSVLASIEDTGPGIPPSLRKDVFEPFFTTRDVGDGAGLGLSVAHGIIVNEHGGAITIDDSDLGGARVDVRLLAAVPTAESGQTAPTQAKRQAPVGTS